MPGAIRVCYIYGRSCKTGCFCLTKSKKHIWCLIHNKTTSDRFHSACHESAHSSRRSFSLPSLQSSIQRDSHEHRRLLELWCHRSYRNPTNAAYWPSNPENVLKYLYIRDCFYINLSMRDGVDLTVPPAEAFWTAARYPTRIWFQQIFELIPLTLCTTCPSFSYRSVCFYMWYIAFRDAPQRGEREHIGQWCLRGLHLCEASFWILQKMNLLLTSFPPITVSGFNSTTFGYCLHFTTYSQC